MYQFIQILVPLGICVALPVLIVLIVCRATMNSDNKRAAVLIEAIRANNNIDTDALAKAFARPRRSALEILNRRLLWGCLWGGIGLVLTLVAIIMPIVYDLDPDVMIGLLIVGLILLAIGASFLVVYFVTRKQLPSSDNDSVEE